jgi:nucleotide-binding universal stress UspA family protein
MKRIDKLLVPTDLSENSRRGLLYACSLAVENSATLTVLHVANEFAAWELYSDEFSFLDPAARAWPADRVLSEASLDLNRFLEPHLNAMERVSLVAKRVVLGPIPDQIVITAEDENADMIVMSPSRDRRVRRLFSRSITERVTRMSPCPVLSVAPPLASRPWRGRTSPIFFSWPKPGPAAFNPG